MGLPVLDALPARSGCIRSPIPGWHHWWCANLPLVERHVSQLYCGMSNWSWTWSQPVNSSAKQEVELRLTINIKHWAKIFVMSWTRGQLCLGFSLLEVLTKFIWSSCWTQSSHQWCWAELNLNLAGTRQFLWHSLMNWIWTQILCSWKRISSVKVERDFIHFPTTCGSEEHVINRCMLLGVAQLLLELE